MRSARAPSPPGGPHRGDARPPASSRRARRRSLPARGPGAKGWKALWRCPAVVRRVLPLTWTSGSRERSRSTSVSKRSKRTAGGFTEAASSAHSPRRSRARSGPRPRPCFQHRLTGCGPRRLRHQAREVHQAHLDVLRDAAQLDDPLRAPASPRSHSRRAAPPWPSSRAGPPWRRPTRGSGRAPRSSASWSARARRWRSIASFMSSVEPRDQRIDLGRGEQALAHRPSTKMA